MFIFSVSCSALSSVAKVFIPVVVYGFGCRLHKLMIWSRAYGGLQAINNSLNIIFALQNFLRCREPCFVGAPVQKTSFCNGFLVGAGISHYRSNWCFMEIQFNVKRLIFNRKYPQLMLLLPWLPSLLFST
jgi:hypothetical protein